MGKSINDILNKIEKDRIDRINRERLNLESMNNKRDLDRKDWIQKSKILESVSINQSSSNPSGSGSIVYYRTIINTIWIYPIVDVNYIFDILSQSISIVRVGNNYNFNTLQDLIDFYEAVYVRTSIQQPTGNAGYSLGVGTILKSKRKRINLNFNGLTVVKWVLMEQITNQSDLPSGGSSPDGTIGYGSVYLDWNLDGIADLTSDSVPSSNLDPLRFEIYNQ